ncbi:hypothetical protein SC1_01262 [Sphingopyxis sp. C-1]|nr:hypothetical protein SC1_01262 [Sphingopyxis sp. C-1]
MSGWPRLARSQCHAQGRVSRRRRRALPRMGALVMQNVARCKGGMRKLRRGSCRRECSRFLESN